MTSEALLAAGIGAVVAGIGNLLVWFVFRRPIEGNIEKTKELEQKLDDLEDRRVAKIEDCMTECQKSESLKRKDIYERIEALETQRAVMDRLSGSLDKLADRLQGIVEDVTRAGEKIDLTVKRVDGLFEKQIALGEELARLQGERGGRR
jgi:chromosome segregation ATPase